MWNLKDPVSMVLGLFAVVVGAALERFLTESPMTSERDFAKPWHGELLYWPALMVLLSQVIRFFFGATAHLTETYVLKPAALKPWDIHWFFKDMFFLIIFGVFLVKIALAKSSIEFTHWLIGFSAVDIVWCLIEYKHRHSFWSEWWLCIAIMQLAFTYMASRLMSEKPNRDLYMFSFLAIFYLVLCGLDLREIIGAMPHSG